MLLEAKNIEKRIKFTTVLKDINFSIEEGENLLILGPNGSGKTTLIKLISGLLKPTKGYVRICGKDPFYIMDRSKMLSVVLDNSSFPWWARGIDLVNFVSSIKQVDKKQIRHLANRFGIDDYWEKRIYTYSSGMKRKLAIFLGLLGRSKLIILDEPFVSIDRKARKIVMDFLKEKINESTIIVSTHILLPELEKLFQVGLLLDNGEQVLFDKSARVIQNYTNYLQ